MPYYNRDPKRDHNFDNHPYAGKHPNYIAYTPRPETLLTPESEALNGGGGGMGVGGGGGAGGVGRAARGLGGAGRGGGGRGGGGVAGCTAKVLGRSVDSTIMRESLEGSWGVVTGSEIRELCLWSGTNPYTDLTRQTVLKMRLPFLIPFWVPL